MVDPVGLPDGTVYERSAIEQWLTKHDTSPITGEALPHKVLTPILPLRSLCAAWREAHPTENEDAVPVLNVRGPTVVLGTADYPTL